MAFDFDTAQLSACVAAHDVALLVATGSRVSGRERPDSDLDLAVLSRDEAPLSHRALASLLTDLQDRTHHRVDLVDLAAADALFRREVLLNHALLHVDDRARWVRLATKTLIELDELSWHLDALVAGVGRRALEGRR